LPNPIRNDEHSYVSHEFLLLSVWFGAQVGQPTDYPP
jgi:hypothetical protein